MLVFSAEETWRRGNRTPPPISTSPFSHSMFFSEHLISLLSTQWKGPEPWAHSSLVMCCMKVWFLEHQLYIFFFQICCCHFVVMFWFSLVWNGVFPFSCVFSIAGLACRVCIDLFLVYGSNVHSTAWHYTCIDWICLIATKWGIKCEHFLNNS